MTVLASPDLSTIVDAASGVAAVAAGAFFAVATLAGIHWLRQAVGGAGGGGGWSPDWEEAEDIAHRQMWESPLAPDGSVNAGYAIVQRDWDLAAIEDYDRSFGSLDRDGKFDDWGKWQPSYDVPSHLDDTPF